MLPWTELGNLCVCAVCVCVFSVPLLRTNEKALVQVLMQRPKAHLQQVRAAWKAAYKSDLESVIKKECGGAAQEAFLAALQTEEETIAVFLQRGMAGKGTDEEVIIDCICPNTPLQIRRIEEAYNKLFTIHMRSRIKLETSSDLQDVFDACMNNTRPEQGIQESDMQADLETFFKATEGKLGTDESSLAKLIATRSKEHLVAMNARYSKRSPKGRNCIEVIQSETSGPHMLALMASFMSAAEWYAYRIHESLKGVGTKEEPLLRAIFVAPQHELRLAQAVLQEKYKEDLVSRISLEVSGILDDLLVTYCKFTLTQ